MDPAIFPYSGHKPTTISRKSRHKCCVKSCKSRISRGLSFHFFPKPHQFFIKKKNEQGNIESIDRLDAWKIAVCLDKINAGTRICSLHFRKDDYFFTANEAKRRHLLRRYAVPTLFVPNDTFKSLYIDNNQDQIQSDNQTNMKNNEKIVVKEEIEFVEVKSEPFDEMLSDEETGCSSIENAYSPATYQRECLLSKSKDMCNVKNFQNAGVQVRGSSVKTLKPAAFHMDGCNIKTFKHVAIQVDVLYSSLKILDFIESDSDLNTLTGIQTFEALAAVVKSVKDESRHKYERISCEMKTKDRVIMTCAKIKHNLSYSFLTVMFRTYSWKMSNSSCRQIYSDMIKLLYYCLKKAPAEKLTALTLKRLNLENYQNLSEDK